MSGKIHFLFVIHCHQPVGNFDFICEDSYNKSYLPFLQVIERHPSVKITLHMSGVILEWIKKHHPEFIDMVKQMCDSGQVEMMGGGYYEPILSILPDYDKLGQIRKLNAFIKKNFGVHTKGMWLAERVWEPYLAKPIRDAGQEYIVLDDHHFKRAGISGEQLKGYFLTEEQGNILKVLPGSEVLRYLMPFHPPEETINYLGRLRSDMNIHYIAMADDGEKFGVWPGTYDLVYEHGWLDKFCTLLEENAEWLESVTCSEYIASHLPVGTAYFPTCSYREMDEWVLPFNIHDELDEIVSGRAPVREIGELMRGGIWRNFLVKYPEANIIHKKMLYVSNRIAELREISSGLCKDNGRHRGINTELEEMTDELWKGQCNDIYWHGIFGGLYLPHMRSSLYNSLVKAEVLIEKFVLAHVPEGQFDEYRNLPRISRGDYNYDLEDEFRINTEKLFIYCDPAHGGTFYECGYKPNAFNVMSTLARRRESYHKKLLEGGGNGESNGVTTIHDGLRTKESGLEKLLYFDQHEKRSLQEHFIKLGTGIDQYRNNEYDETGDFVSGRYTPKLNRQNSALTLTRMGMVEDQLVKISKHISACQDNAGIAVSYKLQNMSDYDLETLFGVEFNINFLAGNAPDRYYHIVSHELEDKALNSVGILNNVSEIRLIDEWIKMGVYISVSKPCTLWRYPIETVSSSEGGLEKVYQSSSIFPHWELKLRPSEVFNMEILFSIQDV